MDTYGIFRVEKIKGSSDCWAMEREHERTEEQHKQGLELDRSDIDWSRTDENEHLIAGNHYYQHFKDAAEKYDLHPKKDAVNILDGLFTASPEWFDTHTEEEAKAYFRDCLKFYIEHMCQGDASRVVSAVIHTDETTPHMHIVSVPLYEDGVGGMHMSAKDVCGNNTEYRKRQDLFYEEVTKQRGMSRGEPKTKEHAREHLTVTEYKEVMAAANVRAARAKIATIEDAREIEGARCPIPMINKVVLNKDEYAALVQRASIADDTIDRMEQSRERDRQLAKKQREKEAARADRAQDEVKKEAARVLEKIKEIEGKADTYVHSIEKIGSALRALKGELEVQKINNTKISDLLDTVEKIQRAARRGQKDFDADTKWKEQLADIRRTGTAPELEENRAQGAR